MKSTRVLLSMGAWALLGFSSCGQPSDPALQYDRSQFYPSDSSDWRQKMLDEAYAYCGVGSAACPGEVGMLVWEESNGVGQCSTFLIGPDVALTNSHCIASEVKSGGSATDAKMKIVYPQTGIYPTEEVTVAQVLSFTDIDHAQTGTAMDLAVLKLSRVVSRSRVSLSSAGIPDQLKLEARVVNPASKSRPVGEISIKQCQSVMGSLFNPAYSTAYASVVTVVDCDVIHGNSGSELVDTQGNVRAIVQAALSSESRSKLSTVLKTEIKPMNAATNLSCASIPGVISPNPTCVAPDTQGDLPAHAKELQARANERLAKQLQEKVEQWKLSNSKEQAIQPIRFTPEKHQMTRSRGSDSDSVRVDYYVPTPTCLENGVREFKKPSKGRLTEEYYTINENFDSYLRYNAEIKVEKVSYDLLHYQLEGKRVTMDYYGGSEKDFELESCSP